MKKGFVLLVSILMFFLFPAYSANAQAYELAKLAVDIEILNQLRKNLRLMYDYYEIVKNGYNKVVDLTNGSFKVHELFLDGLYAINPNVMGYHRVSDIVEEQLRIIKECNSAYSRFNGNPTIEASKLAYLKMVYNKLIVDSVDDLNDLINILTAGKLRMSDDERIKSIDRIYNQVDGKLLFLYDFNSQYSVLVIQKYREKQELLNSKKVLGIPN